eukprot:TRINITY_DN59677_c0_g1_i1.p1 TRINITY_DN59677_c0_g1~~TRINITY_DN59677_c0_g1_i1.p1  ORF type:complete len:695 (-),score=145.18 TRINITY_DN59677_c0_g1_i1:152-2236(-)
MSIDEGGPSVPVQNPGIAGISSALGNQSLPTLVGVLGADRIQALQTLSDAEDADGGGTALAVPLSGSSQEVFAQVLQIVRSLQEQLQESEPLVADLQERADSLEEKRRLLLRRAEHAERDRDLAVQKCAEVEAAAKRARDEAAPAVARFMEAEILRSQLQSSSEELVRLKHELIECKDELARGRPRLAELEEDEAECAAAIAELEAARKEEIAVLRSIHMEEMADMRAEHAANVAEFEKHSAKEVAHIKTDHCEQMAQLRSASESARWQADVYVREHQDAVRELCIRQRENARLAKKHGEVRQEALELAVKLEALKAAEVGAPAREAELQAMHRRYALLQQTAAEWREALVRKQGDCVAWRRRAEQRGGVGHRMDEDVALEAEMQALVANVPSQSSSPAPSGRGRRRPSTGGWSDVDAFGYDLSVVSMASPSPGQGQYPSGNYGGRSGGPWTFTPTPSRTPQMPVHRNQQYAHHHGLPSGAPQHFQQRQQEQGRSQLFLQTEPIQSSFARSTSMDRRDGGNLHRTPSAPSLPSHIRRPNLPMPPIPNARAPQHSRSVANTPSQHPAGEFFAVVLKAALLRAKAAGSASLKTEFSSDDGGLPPEAVLGGPLPSGIAPDSATGKLIIESENEVEMLTFLLEESDAAEAEILLEMEANQRQEKQPAVAARLRAQLEELAARSKRRSMSPHSPLELAW